MVKTQHQHIICRGHFGNPHLHLDDTPEVDRINSLSNTTFQEPLQEVCIHVLNYDPNHPQIIKFLNKYGRDYL